MINTTLSELIGYLFYFSVLVFLTFTIFRFIFDIKKHF